MENVSNQNEIPATSPRGFKDFFALLRKTKPPVPILVLALVLSVATTLVGLIIPLFTKSLVDGFSVSSLSAGTIALIAVAFIAQALVSALASYLLSYSGQKVVAALRDLLWKKQLTLPVSYFDGHQSGDLISRMNNDTTVLKTLVADNISGFFTGIISMIGALAFLFWLDWRMTLVILTALPIAAAIMVPLGRMMSKIARGTMDENAKFTTILTQVLSEIRLVKASNAEPKEYTRGRGAIDRLFHFGLKEGRTMALVAPLMGIVMMALLVVIIGYGGMRVASGALTAGSLVAFILYLIQIVMPVTQITTFFTQLQKTRGATASLISILENDAESPENGAEVPSGHHALRFEDVSFAYRNGERVISDVSFELVPNTITAIVGPSGAGKTTLFSLLERFYRPETGKITYAGLDLDGLSLSQWRERIGYVPQESPLMAGTIRDNISYGMERTPSEEEMVEAATMAYADEFIKALPQGYDTEVGERGIKLSGGQRQRIAIARALLRNPSILMLDEATSSLDSSSEHWVQLALQNLMQGRTTLIIAHRLSTVVDADRIIFLEKGAVTGSGTHDELVKNHSLYRSFAEQQLRYAEAV